MKGSPPAEIAAHVEGTRGLERIVLLEAKLARAPLVSRQRRELTKAIEIAAAAYRMTLDNEQTNAAHDPSSLADRATIRRVPRRKSRSPQRSRS